MSLARGQVQQNRARGQLQEGPGSGKQPGGQRLPLCMSPILPSKEGHGESNRPGGQLQRRPSSGNEEGRPTARGGPMTLGCRYSGECMPMRPLADGLCWKGGFVTRGQPEIRGILMHLATNILKFFRSQNFWTHSNEKKT